MKTDLNVNKMDRKLYRDEYHYIATNTTKRLLVFVPALLNISM
jgi:hypothetical protein